MRTFPACNIFCRGARCQRNRSCPPPTFFATFFLFQADPFFAPFYKSYNNYITRARICQTISPICRGECRKSRFRPRVFESRRFRPPRLAKALLRMLYLCYGKSRDSGRRRGRLVLRGAPFAKGDKARDLGGGCARGEEDPRERQRQMQSLQ